MTGTLDKKEKVDTLVVSDIHLGSELSMPHALSQALGHFSFNRLILNGDTFDHLNFEPARGLRLVNLTRREQKNRLKESHFALLRELEALAHAGVEVIWIEGNHDEGLKEVFASIGGIHVHEEYAWDYRGKRFLALHGDQFDDFYHRHPFWYELGTSFYSLIQKLGPWSKKMCWFLKRKTKWYTHALDSVTKGALAHAREREIDYIMCGHTHFADQQAGEGVRYFNSGSWTESPCHLVAISESGINIHAFSEDGKHIGSLSSIDKPAFVSIGKKLQNKALLGS